MEAPVVSPMPSDSAEPALSPVFWPFGRSVRVRHSETLKASFATTIAPAIHSVNSARFDSVRYIEPMEVSERRVARLRLLLSEHDGNRAKLARHLGKAPAQVNQWFNGVRTITERSAREIESKAGRPEGWLDASEGEVEDYRQTLVVTEALNSLGRAKRREVLSYIAFVTQQAGQTGVAERLARYARDDGDDITPTSEIGQ